MRNKKLGELEELLLLTVARLQPESYGVSVRKELLKLANRRITLSTVHESLNRLLEKGYLKSEFGESTAVRGGKRKKYFFLTNLGSRALVDAKQLREKMWEGINLNTSKA